MALLSGGGLAGSFQLRRLFAGRSRFGFSDWLRLRHYPLRRLEADIFADAQPSILPFEQIANLQRSARFPQLLPRIVFMQGRNFATWFVIFRFDGSATGNMRRPAELLPWRIFHAIDPEKRHSLYIVIDASARFPSISPSAMNRSMFAADQRNVSRSEPNGCDGSMRIVSREARGWPHRSERWRMRNGSVVRQLSAITRVAPISCAAHN